jgi:hypothetical protein
MDERTPSDSPTSRRARARIPTRVPAAHGMAKAISIKALLVDFHR